MNRVLPLALCFLCLAGCGKKVDKEQSAIVVNGESISRAKVNQAAEILRQGLVRAYPQKSFQSMGSELYKAAAYQLVSNIVILSEAKKQSITVSDSVVNNNFEMLKKRFPDQEAFQRELTLAGQTEEGMKKEFTEGMVMDSFLKQLLKNVDTVKEEECQAFYEKNSSKYISNSKIRANQVMFPVNSSSGKENNDSIKKTVESALQQIKNGSSIEKIVKKYSKNGAMGGDIGWFQKGDLKPSLEDALSKLKKGEVSEIISTDVGYVILQKTGEEEGKALPYEEVKNHVRFMVEMKRKNDFVTAYVDSLIKKAKVAYNDTSLTPLPPGTMDSLLVK